MDVTLTEKTKRSLSNFWKNKNNKNAVIDVAALFIATIVFHILYWETDMQEWIFGPYSNTVFNFFTQLAFDGSKFLNNLFLTKPFETYDTAFYFYSVGANGQKNYYAILSIVHDCSAVKQLLQWLLIMLLCRGKIYMKALYYLLGCVVILIANLFRILLLSYVMSINIDLFAPIHDWITRPAMYLIIFAMWYIWTDRFASKKSFFSHQKA
ncbi:MAG: exosortase/archaeosortase family protein [Bacteroidales bacterium]|nr:exosortase/archaeosortase family protein [Bacteroidales bacterium]